jgi:hypothetical protein
MWDVEQTYGEVAQRWVFAKSHELRHLIRANFGR